MSTLQIMPWDQKDQCKKLAVRTHAKFLKINPPKMPIFRNFPQSPTRRTHGQIKIPDIIWEPCGAMGPQTMVELSGPILRFDVFSPAQCVKRISASESLTHLFIYVVLKVQIYSQTQIIQHECTKAASSQPFMWLTPGSAKDFLKIILIR